MSKLSLIIMMLLATAHATKAADLSDEAASRINYEYIWVHGLQTAVTEAFLEFYAANFEGEVHIQKKLIADKKAQAQTALPNFSTKVLVSRTLATAEQEINNIFAGVFEPFKAALKTDLYGFTMSALRKNLQGNKTFLYDALNTLLGDLYRNMLPKAGKVNHPPILHGKTGLEFAAAKANIVARLRRLSIALQLNKAKLILSLYGDSMTDFASMPSPFFVDEIEKYILGQLKGDVADESNDYVQDEVIPVLLSMNAKKMGSVDGKAWHFINLRVNKLIGLTLSNEQQKALFRQLLKSSLSQPGKNIDNVEYGERFKRFVNERLPSFLSQLKGTHLDFAKLDQFACNPAAFDSADHTLLLFDHLARFNGNINNYLFFLRYFRYYDDAAALDSGLAPKQDAIFFALYKALLNQRVLYENVHYRVQNWIDYIKGSDFFADFKNGAQKDQVPIVLTLTALIFDSQIPFPADLFRGLDTNGDYFRAMAANGAFFVDYKFFLGAGFPQIAAEFHKSIVIPQVGQVTDAEHAVLSSPESLKVVKEKLLAGEKVFKMTDLDPTFTSDQEVYIYLHESKNKPCDHSPEQLVDMF